MRERCFGEMVFEVDKMAGLRPAEVPTVCVKYWDQQKDYNLLRGTLMTEGGTQWGGELLTSALIDRVMGQTHAGETPLPYRLRSGRLGKPKSVASMRFNSLDGRLFTLDLIDLRNKSQKLVSLLSVVCQTRTTLKVAGIEKVLFDPERDENKLKRLRGDD